MTPDSVHYPATTVLSAIVWRMKPRTDTRKARVASYLRGGPVVVAIMYIVSLEYEEESQPNVGDM